MWIEHVFQVHLKFNEIMADVWLKSKIGWNFEKFENLFNLLCLDLSIVKTALNFIAVGSWIGFKILFLILDELFNGDRFQVCV